MNTTPAPQASGIPAQQLPPAKPLACTAAFEAAIATHRQKRPQDRTFKTTDPQGETLWVKTPSTPRLRWLYTFTNRLVAMLGMPYFQAPPHAGGPGGIASLQIEKHMLQRLAQAGIAVPQVVAEGLDWIALTSVGEKNLDEYLQALAPQQRLTLWQQVVIDIANAHAKGGYFSQCFARNLMLHPIDAHSHSNADAATHTTNPPPEPSVHQIYFLDFEEDPAAVMTLAQAQVRDWALFLHSTATYMVQDMPACQAFLTEKIRQESPQTQQQAHRLFKQLARLTWLKRWQWLGRDGVRLYQVGVFASGLVKCLSSASHTASQPLQF